MYHKKRYTNTSFFSSPKVSCQVHFSNFEYNNFELFVKNEKKHYNMVHFALMFSHFIFKSEVSGLLLRNSEFGLGSDLKFELVRSGQKVLFTVQIRDST